MDMQTDRDAMTLYSKLEDRVMARDQVGASQVYYDIVRAMTRLKPASAFSALPRPAATAAAPPAALSPLAARSAWAVR